jgi:hypothetical protein
MAPARSGRLDDKFVSSMKKGRLTWPPFFVAVEARPY